LKGYMFIKYFWLFMC